MRPRTKSALLWGAVGLLAFSVAVQGFQLVVGGLTLPLAAVAGVALAVGAVTAAAAYAVEPRLLAKGRS